MIKKLITTLLPFLPESFVWLFSKRYIAGKTIEDAIRESLILNNEGISVTVDILGEYIKELYEAELNRKQYIDLVNKYVEAGIAGYFSVKPSMFGLLIDNEACYNNLRAIVRVASENDFFVRIDMEDSSCTEHELDLYSRLRNEFPGSVGIVLQSYLKRTYSDLVKLGDSHSDNNPVNIRLCKGIYIESAEIAYKSDSEIREWFVRETEYMFKKGIYIGIATHDKYLVDSAIKLIEKHKVPKNKYEFQMLFGVTPELRKTIVSSGHPMRVYVPYGKEWFGYCTRRLKENPNMVYHIIKALFIRG